MLRKSVAHSSTFRKLASAANLDALLLSPFPDDPLDLLRRALERSGDIGGRHALVPTREHIRLQTGLRTAVFLIDSCLFLRHLLAKQQPFRSTTRNRCLELQEPSPSAQPVARFLVFWTSPQS